MNYAVDIQDLQKTYADGTQALKGVSLTIEKGDFFALLGANGAGKTTTIGILTSLVNKNEGRVQVFGHNLDEDLNVVKQQIGVVPQEFNFSIFEKVEDIVVWQSGYFGVPRSVGIRRTHRLLKDLGLWEKRNMPAKALSGGMKRRLMIARALVHKPKLLILDEPTAGVDVKLRRDMWKYLKDLNAKGTTILLTTHYLEEVEQLCNKVAILREGKVLKQDRVQTLLRSLEKQSYVIDVCKMPKHLKVKGFSLTRVDAHTLEADLEREEPITKLIQALAEAGVLVNDIRPKSNRMEQLYLNLLQ